MFNLSQHYDLSLWVKVFTSGGQSIGDSVSASVFQIWFTLGLTSLISLQSKGLSKVFSNTIVYFFFSFIFISWRLITSQHFSGFCHILTWISHGVTCIPHPNTPPTSLSTQSLWVFPVHQAGALVSCIQPGLVICFTIDNMHAVLSKHPTLTFSHRVQNSVLYICVFFSVLHIGLSLPSF